MFLGYSSFIAGRYETPCGFSFLSEGAIRSYRVSYCNIFSFESHSIRGLLRLFHELSVFSSCKTFSSLLLSHPFTLIVLKVTKLGISDGKGVR